MHPPEQRHFQVIARLRHGAHIDVELGDDLESPEEILAGERGGQRADALSVALDRKRGIPGPVGVYLQHHQIAKQAGELAADVSQVVTRLHQSARDVEDTRRVLAGDDLDQVEQQIALDQPEHLGNLRGVDRPGPERQHLVERALRVAHAALGRPGDERDRLVSDLDLLGVRDPPELIRDRLCPDRPQLEHLGAREDRVGDLVQLRRRHHEDDVRRRFLHRLEEGIERRGGELVDLVDDEDLVAIAGRADLQPVDDHFADVVDARVRGGVDLEHVEIAPLADLDAHVAGAARVGGGPPLAVERPGQDPGGRRLADAARAGKDESLRDAPGDERVAERLGDALLTDDLIEAPGPPLAREDLIGHGNAGVISD